MQNIMKRFVKDESGATAIEYGLIAALIAVGIIASAQILGTQIAATFTTVSACHAGRCSLSILLSSTARDAPSVLPSAAGALLCQSLDCRHARAQPWSARERSFPGAAQFLRFGVRCNRRFPGRSISANHTARRPPVLGPVAPPLAVVPAVNGSRAIVLVERPSHQAPSHCFAAAAI